MNTGIVGKKTEQNILIVTQVKKNKWRLIQIQIQMQNHIQKWTVSLEKMKDMSVNKCCRQTRKSLSLPVVEDNITGMGHTVQWADKRSCNVYTGKVLCNFFRRQKQSSIKYVEDNITGMGYTVFWADKRSCNVYIGKVLCMFLEDKKSQVSNMRKATFLGQGTQCCGQIKDLAMFTQGKFCVCFQKTKTVKYQIYALSETESWVRYHFRRQSSPWS